MCLCPTHELPVSLRAEWGLNRCSKCGLMRLIHKRTLQHARYWGARTTKPWSQWSQWWWHWHWHRKWKGLAWQAWSSICSKGPIKDVRGCCYWGKCTISHLWNLVSNFIESDLEHSCSHSRILIKHSIWYYSNAHFWNWDIPREHWQQCHCWYTGHLCCVRPAWPSMAGWHKYNFCSRDAQDVVENPAPTHVLGHLRCLQQCLDLTVVC